MSYQHYHVLRSFVPDNVQRQLVQEAINAHIVHHGSQNWPGAVTNSNASLKLELGIGTGDSLNDVLPIATHWARLAFRSAADAMDKGNAETLLLQRLANPTMALTGLALLYGAQASMPSHYDSPTQPGQRSEWLVMLTLGQPVHFVCQRDNVIRLASGDVVVMDAMATLHGVQNVEAGHEALCAELGLPIPSRLGLLFWQGRSTDQINIGNDGACAVALEDSFDLFACGSETTD